MSVNIVVPLAGLGQRMKNAGYITPKPLLDAGDKPILKWSLDSLDESVIDKNLIFVVRQEALRNGLHFYIQENWPESKIVIIDKETSGALQTVLAAEIYIDKDSGLIVYCPDIYFEPHYVPKKEDFDDGMILTFKANSPAYSYIRTNEEDLVIETREKAVISNEASVGIYCFKNWDMYKKYATRYIEEHKQVEHYIAPLYNKIISDGYRIKHRKVDTLHVMGTPGELNFFNNYSYRHLNKKKFVLCCDHSGLSAKNFTIEILDKLNIAYRDISQNITHDCDYNEYVAEACEMVRNSTDLIGLGFCRTGQGINIQANKFDNIISALVYNTEIASKAVQHNAANFFSFPCLPNNDWLWFAINEIINAKFEGGRHQNRMMKTCQLNF